MPTPTSHQTFLALWFSHPESHHFLPLPDDLSQLDTSPGLLQWPSKYSSCFGSCCFTVCSHLSAKGDCENLCQVTAFRCSHSPVASHSSLIVTVLTVAQVPTECHLPRPRTWLLSPSLLLSALTNNARHTSLVRALHMLLSAWNTFSDLPKYHWLVMPGPWLCVTQPSTLTPAVPSP